MSSGSRLTQLLALTKAFPLPKLRQGGTLSIKASSPNIPLHVHLIPQWRDDAHIKLEQTLSPSKNCRQETSIFSKDGNEVTYSDAGEEMDLHITTTTDIEGASKWPGASVISVSVDRKQEVEVNSMLNSSSPVSSFGLVNKHDESTTKAVITDDGKIHSIPTSSTSSSLTTDGTLTDNDDLPGIEKTARHIPYHDGITHFTNTFPHGKNRPPAKVTLTAKIPEKCNVSCVLDGAGADITVKGKLEGENGFDFFTAGGDMTIGKLRGDSIRLVTTTDKNKSRNGKGGVIYVKKSLEAQDLEIKVGEGGRVRGKMINASNANIEVADCLLDASGQFRHGNSSDLKLDDDDGLALIDLSSIYSTSVGDGAHLVVSPSSRSNGDDRNESDQGSLSCYPKKVRVKSNHGHISVQTNMSDSHPLGTGYAAVELGGVNGSFDVSIDQGTPKRQMVGKITEDESRNNNEKADVPLSANIHLDSLSAGQISIVTSDAGDIGLTVDRKVETDLRLLSTPFMNNIDFDVLLEENEGKLMRALEEYDNKISKIIPLDNGEAEVKDVSRIHMKTNAFSGRRCIDLNHIEFIQGFMDNKSEEPDSRFDRANKGSGSVGKVRIDDAANQALKGFSGGGDGDPDGQISEDSKSINRPLVIAATDGTIKLESLSWFGAIARRYSVSERSPNLGRQASKHNR